VEGPTGHGFHNGVVADVVDESGEAVEEVHIERRHHVEQGIQRVESAVCSLLHLAIFAESIGERHHLHILPRGLSHEAPRRRRAGSFKVFLSLLRLRSGHGLRLHRIDHGVVVGLDHFPLSTTAALEEHDAQVQQEGGEGEAAADQ
jgi:hypothetical protein